MKRERRLHLMQLNTIIVFTGCILVSGCSRKTENVAQDTIVKSHVREENGREETEKDYDGQDPEPVTSYEDTAETTVEQPKQPQVEQMNTELPAWESAEPAPPQLRQPEPPASESAEPAPPQPQQPEPPASESAEQAPPQPQQPEPPASESAEQVQPEPPASEAPEPPASEAPEVEVQESSEIHDHQLITQWYGAPPDCSHGGYQMVWCSQCGWVDEEACKSVPPLEHTPVGEEIHHGNCKEDTIVVYTCSQCGEQTGFERHTEPNEHNWVIKKMEIWDEETFTFKVEEVECCEWCNARP